MRWIGAVRAGVTGLALMVASLANAAVDFAAMPVGCSWTTRYSDGQVLTETFLGKSGSKYKTRVTVADNPKALVRTMVYDSKGRMVRKDWADGNWESFTPYSCFTETGACTYRYKNSDGADQKIASKTKAKGKGFAVKAGPVGGAAYPDEYFETGDYGLMTKNKGEGYSAKLVEMLNCGASS